MRPTLRTSMFRDPQGDATMPALLFIPLSLPLACLVGVSLLGFLGVFAIAGALQVLHHLKLGRPKVPPCDKTRG
jgi:hypothetical protein